MQMERIDMTNDSNATHASASAENDDGAEGNMLYGWSKGGKKSPRLFAERWHAERAARNHQDRNGGEKPKVSEVADVTPEQVAWAQAYGTVARAQVPTQAGVA